MLQVILVCLLGIGVSSTVLPTNNDGRIIGGEDATIEEFPYQISLRSYSIPVCGGTILNANTIVTAAHCTYGKVAEHLTIRAGSTSKEQGGQLINVGKIIPHEKYNRLNQDNDICILKLESPLEFNDGVATLALQETDVEVAADTEAIVSGWGRTVEGDSHSSPEMLRKVSVNVITMEECKKKYPNRPITDRMLCASSGGKDSCQGDSGGPLFANNRLIGVVSWGQGCGNPKYAGVYAKVSALRPWIEQHL